LVKRREETTMKERVCSKRLGTLGNAEVVEIDGIPFVIDPPETPLHFSFIGRKEIIGKALSAWRRVDGRPPLKFRLYGPPGCGKTAIVHELARVLKKELYVVSGTQEFDAGDITCVPIANSKGRFGRILFHATGLLAAAVKGGICFFDELDKLSDAGKGALIPLLNEGTVVQSVLTGMRRPAHEDFLFCAATNENREEGNWLEENLDCKIRPAFHVGCPSPEEIEAILQGNLPSVPGPWGKVLVSEFKDLSARDALNLMQYGFAKYAENQGERRPARITEEEIASYLRSAYGEVVQ
jgi:MoxR-like ATPase